MSILAYRFWRSLSEDEQQKRCSHILVEQNTSHPDFFDASQMYSTVHNGDDSNEDDYDEYNTVSYMGISQFRGQPASLRHSPAEQLTIEDTVQACIDHILAEDPGLKMGDEEAARRMKPFIDARLLRKITKNDKRLDTLIGKINPSSILKRLREGLNTGYPAPDKNKPVRLSVPEFYLRYLDLFIKKSLSPDWQKIILDESRPAMQKAIVKCAMRIGGTDRTPFQRLRETGHTPPFPFDEATFFSQVDLQSKKACALSHSEVAQLLQSANSSIKRLPGISANDIDMLTKLSAKRLVNLLNVMQFGQGPASTRLNRLTHDFFAKLYLNAIDAGVHHARLRSLVKSVYRHLADAPEQYEGHEDYRPPQTLRAAHDLFENHEKHLYAFFDKWTKHAKYTPIINHVVNLLTSEIGGAQGDHKLAFRSLNIAGIPQLCGKEEILLSHSPIKQFNMKDILNLSKQDPAAVLKCNKILENLPDSAISRDHLHVYASNTVGSTNFHTYLSRLKNKRVENEKKFAPLLPATTKAVQREFHGMKLWILPSEDIFGSLGVATQGVCIPFGGDHHFEQQNQAVANLILCDSHQIYLWGLLVRAQNTEHPTYILNNIQGSLPSRYAKHKQEIRQHIRLLLRELGDVYSLDFYFNAIQLLDEQDEGVDISGYQLIVPNMRLDISLAPLVEVDFDHQHKEWFRMVVPRDGSKSYKKVS